ncbi:phage major capsid protein [Priestia megaterium]|uniref:phage major capsid protein n=1 Tax=Priestia megaterium TaxID=1404 RepID=UPI00196AB47E|nr:phage major capsid protein [Priestia megaterium]QSF38446.1 phage major capsid protein [Priestia megaterium]
MAQSNTGVGLTIKNKNLSAELIESKNVPVLGAQFKIFTGQGTEKRLFSLDTVEAGIYGELGTNSVTADDTTFAEISFDQKRVASAIEMTQQAINDEGIGLEAHVKEILIKRLLKKFTNQAFGYGTADGASEFQSILDYNTTTLKVNSTDIKSFTGGATLANIDSAYGEFAEVNAGEAIWVVDSFATVSTLLDEANQLLLKKENRANGSIGTIFNIPVFIQPMNSKAKIVLMNPKAYAVSVSDNSGIKESDNHLSGKKVFTGDVYAHGKVVDPNAIKIIKA